MTGKHWPTLCLIVLGAGAVVSALGQVAGMATGQFEPGLELQERRADEWRVGAETAPRLSRPDGAGPGAGMGIALCWCPLVPSYCAWVAWRCLKRPSAGVDRRGLRHALHAAWAGWCAVAATGCVMLGTMCRPEGELAWEWPGFALLTIGSWLSAAGHLLAGVWKPARAGGWPT